MFRVAIIDDEPKICEGLKQLIDWKALNCQVWTFSQSQAFLDSLETLEPDIVITDIHMPYVNGLDLIALAQKYNSGIKFIILSGYADFEYAHQGLELGVKSYLLKPVGDEALYKAMKLAIEDILEKQKLYDTVAKWQKTKTIQKIISDKRIHALETSIAQMDYEGSRQQLDKIFHALLTESTVDIADLRHQSISILFYVVKNLPDYTLKMNPSLGVDILSISNSSYYKTPEQIRNWLQNIIKSVIDIKKKQEYELTNISLFERIINYVNVHFTDPLSLGDLGNIFFSNPSYISQLFKKNTNMTFLTYITVKRIEKAKELLKVPEYKIYEISETCGYSDVKYFSKLFQKMTGYTPSDYRESYRSDPESFKPPGNDK